MSAGRPSVPEGIGQKSQFQDLHLELKSHKAGEFSTDDNIFKIKIKSPLSTKDAGVKTTYKLTQFKAGQEDKEMPECVFTQTEGDEIVFRLALPEAAWYKFNIFAAPADKEGSLPNVYTYLFDLTAAKKRVFKYPNQFADWKKDCLLHKPLFLDTTKDLTKTAFKVRVKGAKKVAVKAGDEWTHLQDMGDDVWQGDVCLEQYKNKKDVTVNLNACTGSDETQYATLLRYTF